MEAVRFTHRGLLLRGGAALTGGQHDPRQFLGPFIALATVATVIVAMCRALEEEGSKTES